MNFSLNAKVELWDCRTPAVARKLCIYTVYSRPVPHTLHIISISPANSRKLRGSSSSQRRIGEVKELTWRWLTPTSVVLSSDSPKTCFSSFYGEMSSSLRQDVIDSFQKRARISPTEGFRLNAPKLHRLTIHNHISSIMAIASSLVNFFEQRSRS